MAPQCVDLELSTQESAEGADHEMELVLYLFQSSRPDVHLIFQGSFPDAPDLAKPNEAWVTFYSPRGGVPSKRGPHHFRLPLEKSTYHQRVVGLLKVIEYENPGRQICVHLEWPLWTSFDWINVGTNLSKLIALPRAFPQFRFVMRCPKDSIRLGVGATPRPRL
jgi:hypothetical protein